MRIGIVTTSYPRGPGNPSGAFVEAHALALAARGHAIEVVAAGDDDRARPNDDGDRDDQRAHPTAISAVHRVRAPRGLFYAGGAPDALEAHPARLLGAAAFTARLALAVSRRAPRWDAVVAHWLAPSALAALPARAPLLAIAHGGDVFTLRRLRLLAPALAALRLRRARLAFVSAGLREVARAAAPSLGAYLDAALVQPMGVDLARFAAIARAAPVPGAPPLVLVVARLAPIKGVDVAISALAHLRTPARLAIAGDGPQRAELERLAGGRAELLGPVSTARRDELLGQARVVVVPSRELRSGRTEGAPQIALEALAAGVPVIASATGGLRALAAHGVHLVPPDDPRALAAAINRVLSSTPAAPAPVPDSASAAARHPLAHLDWSRVADVLAPTHRSA